MSIINEALKKAQKEFKKTDKKETTQESKEQNRDISKIYEKLNKINEQLEKPVNSTTPENNSQKPKKIGKNVLAIVYIASITGAILLAVLPNVLKNISKNNTPIIQSNIALSSPESLIPISPPPETNNVNVEIDDTEATNLIEAKDERPKIYLSGIMMMGAERVALINNDIYQVGESIEGMKITNITLREVELLDDDEVVYLKVKNSKKARVK